MDGSSRRLLARWEVLGQSALAGAATGIVGITGGSIFLYHALGVLAATAGLVATLAAALAVGLWAGAPAAATPQPALRQRWFGAGLTTALAGILATLWTAYPALQVGLLLRIGALLVLVAAPAYALGLLLPSLLSWAEQRADAAADTEEAGPADWEPLGTIAVGFLGGVAVGVSLASVVLVPHAGAGPALLATAAALIVPTLLPPVVEQASHERVLYEANTAHGSVRVVELLYPGQRQPERRLYVNGEEESGELVRSGTPTLPYIAAAEQWFAAVAARGDAYLFLGGGAYTLPRRVAERDPRASITVVELDPEVTRIAYRFFGMRRHYGIISVHGDARAYLESASDERFDRIFVDVYAGQEALPHSLVTSEAFAAFARLLQPGGTLTLNAIGVTSGGGARRFWSIVRTLHESFAAVALYTHLGRDYPQRQNVLLAAGSESDASFPPRAGRFELWPQEEWPPLEGAVVFRDVSATDSTSPAIRARSQVE